MEVLFPICRNSGLAWTNVIIFAGITPCRLALEL